MRELLPTIDAWTAQGRKIAVATVVKVWGSAPRPIGSHMLVSSSGEISGSVSGGCVEGAVVEVAKRVLESGQPELVSFGVADDVAWSVGLSCGGEIAVFVDGLEVEPATGSEVESTKAGRFEELAAATRAERLVCLATVVADSSQEGGAVGRQLLIWPGGAVRGDLGTPRLNQRVSTFAERVFDSLAPAKRGFDHQGETTDVFFAVYPPAPKLVMVGAVHVAIHLAEFAAKLGFRTVVIDPRKAFATAERFAHVDEMHTTWPAQALSEIPLNETTYFAVLSHDFKIDIPALEIALSSPARYVGVLGSKKTHARRMEKLLEAGVSQSDVDRLHAPIGLDLGGRRAEEVALSVIAEVVAARYGRA